jgi:membrane protease YdiL (CAAX protease family)
MKPSPRAKTVAVYASLLLTFGLWFVMFVVKPFNFFLMMSLSTVFLSLIAFAAGWPLLEKEELTGRNILLGAGSAVVLYAVFLIGNWTLVMISDRLGLIPGRAENLLSIYARQGSLSPALVGVLLFFPIGFGEEVYWRGLVQKYFMSRWGGLSGFWVTTLIYTLVHVPTLNPVLILAAFTCGLFWGGMFALTGSLVPVLISHMVWDPLIFTLLPIQ